MKRNPAAQKRCQCGKENPDQNAAADPEMLQNCNREHPGEKNQRRRIRYRGLQRHLTVFHGDDAAVFESDHRDEKSNPRHNGVLQRRTQRTEHHLPQFRERGDQKKKSRNQNHPHRRLPDKRISCLPTSDCSADTHDAEHDKKIRPHSRCESDRIVRQNSHQNAPQGGGNAGRRDKCSERHSRLGPRHLSGKECGLNADDVRHCRKCGEPRKHFRFEGAAVRSIVKITVKNGIHILCAGCRDCRKRETDVAPPSRKVRNICFSRIGKRSCSTFF